MYTLASRCHFAYSLLSTNFPCVNHHIYYAMSRLERQVTEVYQFQSHLVVLSVSVARGVYLTLTILKWVVAAVTTRSLSLLRFLAVWCSKMYVMGIMYWCFPASSFLDCVNPKKGSALSRSSNAKNHSVSNTVSIFSGYVKHFCSWKMVKFIQRHSISQG